MPSDARRVAIAAGVMRNIFGQTHTMAGLSDVPVEIWPGGTTQGTKAEVVMVHAVSNNIHITLGEPAGAGIHRAVLIANTEYVFPLHPAVDTLMLRAVGASDNTEVHVRHIIP